MTGNISFLRFSEITEITERYKPHTDLTDLTDFLYSKESRNLGIFKDYLWMTVIVMTA